MRKSIPASWYRSTLPLPEGRDADAFIEQLARHLSGRWREAWTWSVGRKGQHEIILATPDPGDMAVLLAHILVLSANEHSAQKAAPAAGNDWILEAPHERAAGLQRIAYQLDRMWLAIDRSS